MQKHDVAIIGGAIMGSATAYFLKRLAPDCSVAVVEPDRTYEFASTLRASGGARRQFSCPENIAMSNFSIPFIKRANEELAVDGQAAHTEWREGGYLFIVAPQEMGMLRANYETQRAHNVKAELLDREQLHERFPSMNMEGIGGGVHSLEDGWCDPNGLLQGLRKKSVSLGACYLSDRAVAIEHDGSVARAVRLASGTSIAADFIVNAAGAWAKEVSAMVEMPLPIEPLRRFEHYFETPNAIEPLPYVKDMARLAFRPEGRGYSGGLVNSSEPRGYNFEIDHEYFDRVVWPALAHRFPAFEACRCRRTWSGLYEQNELDGNPIIGNWPGRMENFFVVSGFSGHGMMHAPAAGRAMAELIVRGRFETLDLANFGYGRVVENRPYPERGII
jgi:glycine/D-amino acid oxidase-like deaminating enzyme